MESYPAPYSPTGYGSHGGEVVVQTPHTVKTLQGEDTEPMLELLATMDGTTPASELVDGIPGATVEYIEQLYEATLAYNAAAIPDGLRDPECRGLLESVLPSLRPATHHELPERLSSLSVAVFGDRDLISPVISRLCAAGIPVDDSTGDVSVGDSVAGEPDVIVLSEQLERSTSWAAVNEQWAVSESTLVKTRLTSRGWRLGPVLTPAGPACLNCIYKRVDANKAGGQLFSETVGGEPPHIRAYTDTVTELLFRTLLDAVPRYLDEQFVVYDHYDQTVETPRVFALPHCEVCNV